MRKIIMRCGAILCAFVSAIVLVLCPFSSKLNSKNFIASADEVVSSGSSFSGSTYPYSIAGGFRFTRPDSTTVFYPYNGFASFSYSFYTLSNGSVDLTITVSNIQIQSTFGALGVVQNVSYSGPYTHTINIDSFDSSKRSIFSFDVESNRTLYITFDYNCSSLFNSNVTSFSIYDSSNSTTRWTNVKYMDDSGRSLVCAIACDTENYSFGGTFIGYSTRTYFVKENLTDNEYYSSGYVDGVSSGYSQGESAGYSTGYTAGDTAGYSRGYNAGVADSNDYSFIGLISAVIDAPISAFTGLFNFEILGVNISGFLLGLFTLCVVIVVVRKLLL